MKTEKLKAETLKENAADHRMMTSPLTSSHARNVIPSGVQRGPARKEDVLGKPKWLALVRIVLIISAFQFFSLSAFSTTVTGNLRSIGMTGLTTAITFTPTNDVLISASGLNVGPPVTYYSTAGVLPTITLEPGPYTISFPLISWRRAFEGLVPPSGSVDISNVFLYPKYFVDAATLQAQIDNIQIGPSPNTNNPIIMAGGATLGTNGSITLGQNTSENILTPSAGLVSFSQSIRANGNSIQGNHFYGTDYSGTFIGLLTLLTNASGQSLGTAAFTAATAYDAAGVANTLSANATNFVKDAVANVVTNGTVPTFANLTSGTNAGKAFTQAAAASVVTNNTSGVTLGGTFTGNGAGLTNVITGTNAAYSTSVTNYDYTKIVLAGASLSGLNGTWVLKTNNAYPYYKMFTNATASPYQMAFNLNNEGNGLGQLMITNGAGDGNSDDIYGAFLSQLDNGATPAWTQGLGGSGTDPTGGFVKLITTTPNTTIVSTNISYYSSLADSNYYLVDPISGNDSLPSPYPLATLTGAFAKQKIGNQITLSAGTIIGNGSVRMSNNVSVAGAGMERTFVRGLFRCGTNNTISDLSTVGAGAVIGTQSGDPIDYLTLRNVSICDDFANVSAQTDGLFINDQYTLIKLYNCKISGHYDCVNYTLNNASSGETDFWQPDIRAIDNFNGSALVRGIACLATNAVFKIYGGNIIASNTATGNGTYCISTPNGKCRIELYGTSLVFTNTVTPSAASAFLVSNSVVVGYWFENGVFKTTGSYTGNGSGITNVQHAVIQTNFISGKSYVNSYGAAITVSGLVSLTVTATAGGFCNLSLRNDAAPVNGGWTNLYAVNTTALSIAMSYTNVISLVVPTNASFTFTNLSTGGANSATVVGGQITY